MRTSLFVILAILAVAAAFDLISIDKTNSTGVSYCGSKCRLVSCGPSWNKHSSGKCCPVVPGSKKSCSKSCATAKSCTCPQHTSSYSFPQKHCSLASDQHLLEKEALLGSYTSALQDLKDWANNKGIDRPSFKGLMFAAFADAYDADFSNLQAFQLLMSQTDPAPPSNKLPGFLFTIFSSVIGNLPGVGPLISSIVSLAHGGISAATTNDKNKHNADVTWKDFIVDRILDANEAKPGLETALNNYLVAYYNHYKIPISGVKGTKSAAYGHLASLLKKFYDRPTSTQAFVHLVGDYLNSVKAGIVVSACGSKFEWRISKINSNSALTSKLMQKMGNCINPATNFKDRHGTPVRIALFSCEHAVTNVKNSAIVGHHSSDFKVCGVSAKDMDF